MGGLLPRWQPGSCDGERRTWTADTAIFSRGATNLVRHAEPSKRPVFAGILGCLWWCPRPAPSAEIPADTRGYREVWAYGRCSSAQTQTEAKPGRMAMRRVCGGPDGDCRRG